MPGNVSETPRARAERLNALARELPDPPEHLPEKEKRYMKAVREIYIRYIRHEITREQAAAERRLFQSSLLQQRNDFGWRDGDRKNPRVEIEMEEFECEKNRGKT